MRTLVLATLIASTAGSATFAQQPEETPKLLRINIETVKPGKGPAHAKHEQGWPLAFSKANVPLYYFAMTPYTGGTDVWYMTAYASYDEMAKLEEAMAKAAGLGAQIDRLQDKDAEFLMGARNLTAELRPELTIGTAPNRAKIRAYRTWTYRVRIGSEGDFERLAKIYLTEFGKQGLRMATYRVSEGVNQPTYLVFRPVRSIAEYETFSSEEERARASMTAGDRAAADSLWARSVLSFESNTYLISPSQSHVPVAFADADPEFWGSNPVIALMKQAAAVQAGAPTKTPPKKP